MMTMVIWMLPYLFTFISTDPFEDCRMSAKFGTKTGYDMLPKVQETYRPSGYKPIQINMIFRHGERFPGVGDIMKMNNFASKINRFKNVSSVANLTLPWVVPFFLKEQSLLAKEGETVLYGLGKRIKSRFPEVFTKEYAVYNYKFASTCTTRTVGSANAFAMGLFEGSGHLGPDKQQPIHLEVYPCDEDNILRPLNNCKRYAKEITDNPDARKEYKMFQNGAVVASLLKRMKDKFGDLKITLNYSEIKLMYILCSWEIIMFNGSFQSGFCSLFSQEDFSIIEYGEDLDDYYQLSTGYNMSFHPSCPLLKDMYQSLQAKTGTATSHSAYEAIFRAAHAETLLPFFALLGVYTNSVKMNADNFDTNKNRTFRTGCLSPFSANLYFVLYQNIQDSSKYIIQLYVNERLTKIPGCSLNDCEFHVFEQTYKDIVNNCDYKKMCDEPTTSSARIIDNNSWILLLLCFMVGTFFNVDNSFSSIGA